MHTIRNIKTIIVLLFLSMLTVMGYNIYLDSVVSERYLPFLDKTNTIELKINNIHLELAKILESQANTVSNETMQNLVIIGRDMAVIINCLNDIDWQGEFADATGSLQYLHEIQEDISKTTKLINLSQPRITKEELPILLQQLHQLDNNFLINMVKMEQKLTAIIFNKMARIQRIEIVLLVTGLILLLFTLIAMQRATHLLSTESEQRNKDILKNLAETKTLNSLASLLNRDITQTEIATGALESISQLLKPDFSVIYLRRGSDLVVLASNPDLADSVTMPDHQVGECLCGLAAEGEQVFSSNINCDSRCTMVECKDAGFSSFAALPLLEGGDVIGVFGLAFLKEHDFNGQKEILATMADQISAGLQKRILQNSQGQQIKLLALHAAIGSVIVREDNIQNILSDCCDILTRELDAAFVRIWTVNESENILEMQASAGLYNNIDGTHSRIPINLESKIGMIAATGSGYLNNHIIDDPLITDKEWVERQNITAFMGNPLKDNGVTMGVLAIFSRHELPKIVIKTIDTIADEITSAIASNKVKNDLWHSREEYKNLIEKTNDWIWQVDENFVYTYCSPRSLSLLGYNHGELIGKSLFDLMLPKEAERLSKLLSQTGSKKSYTNIENSVKHRDGHLITIEINAVPNFDEQKIFRGYHGISRDITEKKRANKEITRQNVILEMIFDAVPDALLLETVDREITLCNHGFINIFGYPEEEVIGQSANFLYEDKTAFKEQQKKYFNVESSSQVLPYEEKYQRKDGVDFTGKTMVKQLRNPDGEFLGFLILIRDISAKKKAEANLRHTQKMEALGTLSGGIAHDFNNILNIIHGYASLVLMDLEEESQIAENINQVLQASKRAAALVTQILAFSRGGGEDELHPLQISILLKEVVKLLKGTLPTTIEIRQEIDPKCRMILADAGQIHQVLMNLCTNSFHAMRDSGGVLTIKLIEESINKTNFGGPPLGVFAKLVISDTGHGISSAVLERIFEPYYTTKKQGDGTGLGLSTVHGIVEGYGGTISVTSKVNKGTTFSVYLPIIESGETIDDQQAGSKTILPSIKGKILFVDDVEFNVNLGTQLLTRSGAEVVGETDSVAALERFKANPHEFDLVITDQTMPQLTGFEMAREMFKIRKNLPVILITGHSEMVDEEMACDIGIRNFMMKPLNVNKLVLTVVKLLSESSVETEVETKVETEVETEVETANEPAVALTASPQSAAPQFVAPPLTKQISQQYLKEKYGISDDDIEMMLGGLKSELLVHFEKIKEAMANKDKPDLKILATTAHTIKGALLNLGSPWAEVAKEIELGAKDGEKIDYQGKIAKLKTGLASFL